MTCIDVSCASCMLYKVGKKTDAFHTQIAAGNLLLELRQVVTTSLLHAICQQVCCNLSTDLLQVDYFNRLVATCFDKS